MRAPWVTFPSVEIENPQVCGAAETVTSTLIPRTDPKLPRTEPPKALVISAFDTRAADEMRKRRRRLRGTQLRCPPTIGDVGGNDDRGRGGSRCCLEHLIGQAMAARVRQLPGVS